MSNSDPGPLDYIHQTAVHQLRHAADEIENGQGLVADFDYDEDLEQDRAGPMDTVTTQLRTVTLEVEFLLPE